MKQISLHLKPQIEEILRKVDKPLSYVACEDNAVFKKSADLNFCLIYPDLYELGISNLGINILYSVLNNEKDVWAQRAYMPNYDMQAQLKAAGEAHFSLEEGRHLDKFDVLGFTLPHELCYTNILQILKLSRISARRDERKENEPIIIAGGCGAYNPLPLAKFIDIFVIGEAEEVILEIVKVLRENKNLDRQLRIEKLQKLDGVWAPEFEKKSVNRQIIKELSENKHKPLVPISKAEKRVVVEIMRGCIQGCRFCQAGFIYRPKREKEVKYCYQEAVQGVKEYGLNQVSLLSLSTSDYSQIEPLTNELAKKLSDEKVSISIPSLRTQDFSEKILDELKLVKKTNLTFAIEAGSERLRKVINKNLSEEHILNTLSGVFRRGWHKLKLYFMVGLPTETQNDLDELVRLVEKIEKIARQNLPRKFINRLNITVNISNFVPKAHTPFQWVAQDNLEKLKEKQNYLIKNIRSRSIRLKWHDAKQSVIEGLIARGDKKTADVIENAVSRGAMFDNFSEHFNFNIWQEALDESGIRIEDYLKERRVEEEQVWDFINTGIEKEFLLKEYEKGLNEAQTQNCFIKCPKCGLCDKDIKNRESDNLRIETTTKTDSFEDVRKKYRLVLKREGAFRFLSHLEWIALIERLLRITQIKLAMKGKFNPRPKLSFSQALPLGYASTIEWVDFTVLGNHKKDDIERKIKQAFRKIEFVELKEEVSNEQYGDAKYELKVNLNGSLIKNEGVDRIIDESKNGSGFVEYKRGDKYLSIELNRCIIEKSDNSSSDYILVTCPIGARPDKIVESIAKKIDLEVDVLLVKKIDAF